MKRVLKLSMDNHFFYVECLDSETVKDLKEILAEKYNLTFSLLEIRKAMTSLPNETKIGDMDPSIFYEIIGQQIGHNQSKGNSSNEQDEQEAERTSMSRNLKDIGFQETDQEIAAVLKSNDNDFASALGDLLLKSRKKRGNSRKDGHNVSRTASKKLD